MTKDSAVRDAVTLPRALLVSAIASGQGKTTVTAALARHPRGTTGEIIYRLDTLTASYFHAYFASCPQAVAALLGGCDP